MFVDNITDLYAIWVLSDLAHKQSIDASVLGIEINNFYKDYKDQYKTALEGTPIYCYRQSLSSNTKGVASRRKRIEALIQYLNSKDIDISLDNIQS